MAPADIPTHLYSLFKILHTIANVFSGVQGLILGLMQNKRLIFWLHSFSKVLAEKNQIPLNSQFNIELVF